MLPKWMLDVIAEHTDCTPIPEQDENGAYVYDLDTGVVLFDDSKHDTIIDACNAWADDNTIVMF